MQNENRIEIEQNLRSAGVYQRWQAMNELATYPATVAVPIFKRLLDEKQDVGLRRLAILGLGKHRTEETFEILSTMLEGNGDPILIAEAANAIFDFGDVAIPILQQLFDRSSQPALWQIRQTVLSLFLDTEYDDRLFALATIAIADETKIVGDLAILAFKKILQSDSQPAAIAFLAELAIAPEWQIRRRVAIALYNCPDPTAKQTIVQLLQDENFRVVAAALEGVGIEERNIE